MDFWKTVQECAEKVRAWAEDYVNKAPKWSYGYGLCGMCGKASARLHSLLNKHGIDAQVASAPGHIFVVVTHKEEDFLVDVTATQFSVVWEGFATRCGGVYDPIEIRPLQEGRHYRHWNYTALHKDASHLEMWQKREGWPELQMATKEEYEVPCNS